MRIIDSGPGHVSYPHTQVFSCCSHLVSRPRGSLSVSKVIMLSCLISHWGPVGSVGQLQLLSLLHVFYSSLGCWEINVWEGKHTKGTMREAGLKLMESGFFERKHFSREACCIHSVERLSAFLHICLILIFSPKAPLQKRSNWVDVNPSMHFTLGWCEYVTGQCAFIGIYVYVCIHMFIHVYIYMYSYVYIQATPVFLPGKSHVQRSLADYSP